MATQSVDLKVNVLGRSYSISCPVEMRPDIEAAATQLDEDLLDATKGREITSTDLVEHLVALALDYLCGTKEDVKTKVELEERIASITDRIANATTPSDS